MRKGYLFSGGSVFLPCLASLDLGVEPPSKGLCRVPPPPSVLVCLILSLFYSQPKKRSQSTRNLSRRRGENVLHSRGNITTRPMTHSNGNETQSLWFLAVASVSRVIVAKRLKYADWRSPIRRFIPPWYTPLEDWRLLGTGLLFEVGISFSSPEAALLLVSTKNRDLWLHSGQMRAHA